MICPLYSPSKWAADERVQFCVSNSEAMEVVLLEHLPIDHEQKRTKHEGYHVEHFHRQIDSQEQDVSFLCGKHDLY